MYIYKLKYLDRESAINDLIAKGVLVEVVLNGETFFSNTAITQSVVDLGVIDGYHFDVMVTQAIDFGTARVTPTNVKHAFLGFNTNDYNQINQNTNTNETTTY
jgi:hypothetical protein